MDNEPSSSGPASTQPPYSPQPSASTTNPRKERGAIATQACETCRSRKQKCDEQRPRCGTCQKFNIDCQYREPQPTKKDKTLVEILDRIKVVEGKIDKLGLQGVPQSTSYGSISGDPLVQTPTPLTSSSGFGPFPPPSIHSSEHTGSPVGGSVYRYVSSVHQMLGWPVIQHLLESLFADAPDFNPGTIEHDGPSIVLGQQRGHGAADLPTLDRLPSQGTPGTFQARLSSPSGPSQMVNSLNWDTMQRLSKSYFDTFNFLYPIVDREVFMSTTLPTIYNDGFDDGITSTLAHLVFALGEVAVAGMKGNPLTIYNGRPSGIKGGNGGEPPGLALFNEARRRMGFNLTECSLENVQIFALAGLYYGTCCYHMEFWRMTTSASLACQALIASNPAELASSRGDIIRRAFWHCSLMETFFNLELGLPLTGLDKFENMVRVPDFSGTFSQDDYMGNQASHFQEHFASQIVLRRLSVDFHNVLSNGQRSASLSFPGTPSQSSSSIAAAIKPLMFQLDHWRGSLLPVHLRWHEGDPGGFPNPSHEVYGAAYPPPATSHHHSAFMFTSDLDSEAAVYPYALDIQVAMLRTRYYYTKYLIHRPFLYKALHHPDQMVREDAEGVAECLKACLKWPVAMSPTCSHKRLVPCLFFWTQNLFGILVILHLSEQVPILMRIRSTMCGEHFEVEANETVALAIDWIRDLKSIDPAARWAWMIVKTIYHLEDS